MQSKSPSPSRPDPEASESSAAPKGSLPSPVREQLLQAQTWMSEMDLDRAAPLLESLLPQISEPGDQLLARALHLSLHLQSEASRGDALLLQEAYDLCQQAAALVDDPLVEVLALFPLAELQTRLRLHHAALSSLERALQLSQRAQSQNLSDQLQAVRGRIMAQAGMYEELIKNSDALLARRAQMRPGTVHRILNYCATACFVLADEQLAPPGHPLWLRCRAHHLDALQLAQQHGLQEDVHLSSLNLAYIELLAGDTADARPHIERLLRTGAGSVWRQIAGARQALQLSQTLLAWREHPDAPRWQALLDLEAELAEAGDGLRFAHEYLLRTIVRFGEAAGDSSSALRCSQRLLSFQRLRLQAVAGTLSRAVDDVFQLQRVRLENEQLARHGGQLEQSLAARNAELQQTLSRLQAEASIRRAAEAALQQANEELEARVLARTASLEEALRTVMQQEKQLALGRMVVGMAHELNTPLGNARMGASVIRDRAQELEQWLQAGQLRRQALSETASSLQQCSSLVDRSLESASQLIQRLKALSLDSEQEMAQDFDASALMHRLIELNQARCQAAGIDLAAELPAAMPMFGPMQSLHNVVQELLDNAVDHGLKDRSAAAAPARIQLRLRRDDGADGEALSLSLEDNGCGIPAEALPRIFDPFFSGRLGSEGAGLGLSVVRTVVEELMQGQIRIDSELGRGTWVRLRLPLR